MPSMSKWIDESVKRWAAKFRRREVIDVSRRILPDTLQADLLQGIEREREAVLARLRVIEGEIEKLRALRAEALKQEQEAARQVRTPAKMVTRLDGSVYNKPAKDRGVRQATQESIAARRARHNIARHLEAFEREKQGRLTELGELRRLQAQTEAGALTALVHIAERWRHPVLLGGQAQRVKGPNEMWGGPATDRFGNPLPEEALDESGEPDLDGLHGSRVTSLISDVG